MKLRTKSLTLRNLILFCCLGAMACGLVGCEAFVRKFTRKPKKEDLPRTEMVLTPEEYKGPQMTKLDIALKIAQQTSVVQCRSAPGRTSCSRD